MTPRQSLILNLVTGALVIVGVTYAIAHGAYHEQGFEYGLNRVVQEPGKHLYHIVMLPVATRILAVLAFTVHLNRSLGRVFWVMFASLLGLFGILAIQDSVANLSRLDKVCYISELEDANRRLQCSTLDRYYRHNRNITYIDNAHVTERRNTANEAMRFALRGYATIRVSHGSESQPNTASSLEVSNLLTVEYANAARVSEPDTLVGMWSYYLEHASWVAYLGALSSAIGGVSAALALALLAHAARHHRDLATKPWFFQGAWFGVMVTALWIPLAIATSVYVDMGASSGSTSIAGATLLLAIWGCAYAIMMFFKAGTTVSNIAATLSFVVLLVDSFGKKWIPQAVCDILNNRLVNGVSFFLFITIALLFIYPTIYSRVVSGVDEHD